MYRHNDEIEPNTDCFTTVTDNTQFMVSCIGVDNKRHFCFPWATECICGCIIKKKNPTEKELNKAHFTCIECTWKYEFPNENPTYISYTDIVK